MTVYKKTSNVHWKNYTKLNSSIIILSENKQPDLFLIISIMSDKFGAWPMNFQKGVLLLSKRFLDSCKIPSLILLHVQISKNQWCIARNYEKILAVMKVICYYFLTVIFTSKMQ